MAVPPAAGFRLWGGVLMPTYRFQEVKHREERSFVCTVCDKKGKRSRTFTNTINPFNKDPETGLMRSYQQIVEKLRAEGAEWSPVPVHDKCQDAS